MNRSYILVELWRRPKRTIGTILSIALGVALFLSLQSYSNGYRQAARAPLADIGADIAAQRQGAVPQEFAGLVFPHSVAPIHQADIAAVRALPGVEAVGEAMFVWDFAPDHFLVALGVDPAEAVGPGRLRAAVVSGRFLNPGDSDVAVADASFARTENLVVGHTVQLGGHDFTLVGTVDTSRAGQVANANLYVPIADARTLTVAAPNIRSVHDIRADDANILFIRANQSQAEAVVAALPGVLGPKAIISSARSFSQVLGATFQLVDRFGWVVGLAGLVIALAGLLRAVAASLWERRRDIGLMRAVGWQRLAVIRQLTSEVLAIASIGSVLGVVLAAGVSLALSQTVVTIPVPWELSPTPHFLPGGARELSVTVALPARIEPVPASLIVSLALIGSAVVGLVLANRASKTKPAEVLRSE